jgi:hypothetical protein
MLTINITVKQKIISRRPSNLRRIPESGSERYLGRLAGFSLANGHC